MKANSLPMQANTVSTRSHFRSRSNWTFLILVIIAAILSAMNLFLPQGTIASGMPVQEMPASLPVMALVVTLVVLVLYGGLGAIGLLLARKLELPDLWDPTVSNRQRFLIPALAGLVLSLIFIASDLLFAPYNGFGRLIHPPFPTSLVASAVAGINEEIIFRLFFVSFWTWLVGRVLLRGRGLPIVYGIVSLWSALAFGAGHFPALLFLFGAQSLDALPAVLIAEVLLLNGILSLVAAYLFKRSGYLAAAGVHFWTDIFWHVVWGLL
jgi:hypothetical protein